jgi:hypothetical protein
MLSAARTQRNKDATGGATIAPRVNSAGQELIHVASIAPYGRQFSASKRGPLYLLNLDAAMPVGPANVDGRALLTATA